MPLFTTLFPLTKRAALTVLIVAEGDQLRVNVMPKSKDGSEEKTIYPLSLLASPEELDRDFAEAVSIYEPGSQSVLDQARAASAANNNGEAPKALPAPSKGKGGRKRAAELPPPDASGNGPNAGAAGDASPEITTEVDPRQTTIPGLETQPEGAAAAETPLDNAAPEVPQEPGTSTVGSADEGIDLL